VITSDGNDGNRVTKRKPLPDRVEDFKVIDVPSSAVLFRRYDAKGDLIESHFELENHA